VPDTFTPKQYGELAQHLGVDYTAGDESNPDSAFAKAWQDHVQQGINTEKAVADYKQLQPQMARLQITSDQLKNKGYGLSNALTDQRMKLEAAAAGTTNAKDALKVIQDAATTGDPATIEAIQEEKSNPGTYPQYGAWAKALTGQRLSDALDLANANKVDAAQARATAKEKAQLALQAGKANLATAEAGLPQNLADGYTPDQLQAMATAKQGDPSYDTVLSPILAKNGMMLASATAKSAFNQVVQQYSDPRVKQAASQLAALPGMPPAPGKIQGVGITMIGRLMTQAGITDSAVRSGLQSSIVAAWNNANDKNAEALAEHDIRMALYSVQLANEKAITKVNQKKAADLNNPKAAVNVTQETSVLTNLRQANQDALGNHNCTSTASLGMGPSAPGANAGTSICNYLTWYGDGITARINALSAFNTGNTKALEAAPQQTPEGQQAEFRALHPDIGLSQNGIANVPPAVRSALYGSWRANPTRFEEQFLNFAQGPAVAAVTRQQDGSYIPRWPQTFWPAFRQYLDRGAVAAPGKTR
jgi:hypothetical protein